jgi:transcriptional regulator GlxA family with amidase domain
MRKVARRERPWRILIESIDTSQEPVKASVAARLVSLSRSHFSLEFRRLTGTTFRRHLILVRLARAEHFLRTTNASMEAIAEALGYAERSSFEKAFKRQYGMTPRVYRCISDLRT